MSPPAASTTDVLQDASPARALAAWVAALEAAGAASPGAAERSTWARRWVESWPRTCARGTSTRRTAARRWTASRSARPTPAAHRSCCERVRRRRSHGAARRPALGRRRPTGGAHRLDADVRIRHPAEPGSHVRPAGEDVAARALVAVAGRRLGPADLGLAVACGHADVLGRPRPHVGLIPTGDEVRPPGSGSRPARSPTRQRDAVRDAARGGRAARRAPDRARLGRPRSRTRCGPRPRGATWS